MSSHVRRETPAKTLKRLRSELRDLKPSHPLYRPLRTELMRNIQLAKQKLQRRPKSTKRSSRRRTQKRPVAAQGQAKTQTAPARKGLSAFLTPENIQESMKAVGSLRKFVRNCAQYLQQADQMLETFYVTSNTLKETGVLDKIVKHKGKNLTTEDFTNILVALMNTPLAAQWFKGGDNAESAETTAPQSAPAARPPAQPGLPGSPGQNPGYRTPMSPQ